MSFNIKTDDALDYHRGSLQSFPGKNAATFLNPVHNWQVYICCVDTDHCYVFGTEY